MSYIYFIREQGRGNIKIGITKDPVVRLAQLQSGNPDLLAIEAMASGGEIAEYALHVQFHGHRIRGEWFLPAPVILAFMETLPSFQDAELGEPLPDLDAEFAITAAGYKAARIKRPRLKRG